MTLSYDEIGESGSFSPLWKDSGQISDRNAAFI